METKITDEVNKIAANPNVTGVVLTNAHGLCIATSGNASPEAAGVINEIVNQAQKLEPSSKPPVVLLDYNDKQCLIQRNGDIVGAIYKTRKQ